MNGGGVTIADRAEASQPSAVPRGDRDGAHDQPGQPARVGRIGPSPAERRSPVTGRRGRRRTGRARDRPLRLAVAGLPVGAHPDEPPTSSSTGRIVAVDDPERTEGRLVVGQRHEDVQRVRVEREADIGRAREGGASGRASGRSPRRPRRRRRSRSSGGAGRPGGSRSGRARRPGCGVGSKRRASRRRPPADRRRSGRRPRSGTRRGRDRRWPGRGRRRG